jgi:flagellar assembly factor FliW
MTHRSRIRSPWIGEIEWEPSNEIFFPNGLPGYEREHKLIPVEVPAQRPLVYLQSVENPGVCFLCLPVLGIDPGFELRLSEDERTALAMPEDLSPALGADVLCLAFLIPSGSTVKTNLAAPIVINLHNSRGVQCVDSADREAACRATFRLCETGKWELQPC